MSKKRAIYSGTFDPITNGHLDIIKRASSIFDEIIIAVAENREKSVMFDTSARVEMVKLATAEIDGVVVESFDTLLVSFAKKNEINVIIRGLRAVSDFEYELQMGYANSSLDPTIDTVYLMPTLEMAFVSSSVVRSILKYEGDISHLVPKQIWEYLNVYTN